MKRNILVVAAHPDDEVLGVGGAIAKWANAGDEINCLILGEGITSRYSKQQKQMGEELEELKSQAEKVAKIVGIRQLFFKDFPDNRFDTVPLLTIIKAIEGVKEEIEPDVVVTHHCGDLNIDHQITFKAVLTSYRPLLGETAREIYSFEVPSSTEWGFNANSFFMPNTFIDITETFDNKVEALKVYQGELKEYPHPRSPEALRAIAMKWGSTIGCEFAEALRLVRAIH